MAVTTEKPFGLPKRFAGKPIDLPLSRSSSSSSSSSTMPPPASRSRNRTETIDSMEALLTKKLDELESEMFFLENPKEQHSHHPRPAALLSKLSFLKCLITAEIGGNTTAGRLNRNDARISAMESIFSGDPKTATFRLRLLIVHKNLQELESMANEPLWHQSAAKIRSKIAFTKSLLANEDHSEDLSSLSSRIAAVEEAFVHLSGNDGTQPSCSSTDTEEVGEEEAVTLFLRKKIEDESNGDDVDDDAQKKIAVLRSLFAAEMKWKGEEKEEELDGFLKRFSAIGIESADRNAVVEDTAAPSSCSCTSSCFDGGEEKEKPAKEGDNSVSGVNETGELCSVETEEVMKGKSENTDSEEGDGERRFGKLRAMGAMAGVFAVAAVGVAVGSFFSEEEMVHLVPT